MPTLPSWHHLPHSCFTLSGLFISYFSPSWLETANHILSFLTSLRFNIHVCVYERGISSSSRILVAALSHWDKEQITVNSTCSSCIIFSPPPTPCRSFCNAVWGSGAQWPLIGRRPKEHLWCDGDDKNSSVQSHAACGSSRYISWQNRCVWLAPSRPQGA